MYYFYDDAVSTVQFEGIPSPPATDQLAVVYLTNVPVEETIDSHACV